jgi:hypothetical protein
MSKFGDHNANYQHADEHRCGTRQQQRLATDFIDDEHCVLLLALMRTLLASYRLDLILTCRDGEGQEEDPDQTAGQDR